MQVSCIRPHQPAGANTATIASRWSVPLPRRTPRDTWALTPAVPASSLTFTRSPAPAHTCAVRALIPAADALAQLGLLRSSRLLLAVALAKRLGGGQHTQQVLLFDLKPLSMEPIAGEETALLESLEGKQARRRLAVWCCVRPAAWHWAEVVLSQRSTPVALATRA